MSVYIKISKVLDIFVNYYICKKQKVNLGKYSKICGRIYIENRNPDKEKHISIGDNTIINSGIHKNPIGGNIQTLLVTNPGGRIYIGNNVGMSNVAIFAQEAVVIEDYVMIGGGVCIYDTDFHSLDYETRISSNDTKFSTAPIEIGEGAFIGAHSIILKGVRIGKHAIIGAGSLVTKSVPDGEIWAGNPAHKIY